MEPNTEKNQQAEAQETAQETAKTAEATAAEETTATESAEQPETAAAEAESTTEEDQHMKKKELKAALEKAEAALADHKDQHLRLMAEYQNYRNRTTEEKKKIYGDAKADCIKSLLTAVDTFERAMDAACSDETYKKGIEMTFSQLQRHWNRWVSRKLQKWVLNLTRICTTPSSRWMTPILKKTRFVRFTRRVTCWEIG